MKRIKINPEHKVSFSYGVTANCSCGWTGTLWLGEAAGYNAANEWRRHLKKCEAEQKRKDEDHG